ncbi:MAG: poly-gamma-glutamate system protein [Candidatus Eisenbacteria bacterium]|uniref:Poly-gamma-glutamate system protein n=1 Tax=Eiseniibacteriota bacterium TaxID=2212470 RepID=A0A948RYJ5_UNCEI|nr:poly-gamma-glutamate system protein [Candidatus Eisenbacteria bacterium]MBU1948616.1 poly-gamma-glutamate system protein [Candidatus Eisenbacteria bacterium]MBU2692326.1 poly-gamma-glutamate system protein [Candidatus Eisenbacteria bacterium]
MRRIFTKDITKDITKNLPWTRRIDVFLVVLALIGIGFHMAAEATRILKPQPHMLEKTQAATCAVRCFEAIRQARMGTPAALDAESDPASTGLVGQEFTQTTTDRGVLEAKLTSINPNFAALFVQYFYDIGLKAGDPVAISFTGSFPALNICMLAAAEELNLKPICITSVGASMWGANDPKFTWLDMETYLSRQRLLKTTSVAASLGGSNDRGRTLSPMGRGLLSEAIKRNGAELLYERTLEEAVQQRISIFNRDAGERGIRAYVNIGGGVASIGNSQNGRLIQPGLNRVLKPYNWAQRGALHYYAKDRIPIIHILNIDALAGMHGFPVAPGVVPAVGEGTIYHKESYDLKIVIPLLLVYMILCFRVLRARQRAVKSAREVSTPAPVAAIADQPAGERRGG